MPATIPTTEPRELTAGDSWRWDRSFPLYPASDGWTLRYALRGPNDLNITASAVGDGFEVRAPATQTAGLAAGSYWITGFVSKEDDRHTVYRDRLTVTPNLETEDPRTHAERTLALYDELIERRLSEDVEHFMINGRQVARVPMAELVKQRAHYVELVRRERTGSFFLAPVEVTFGRAR